MNKIYKVIWSKTRNCYVAVAEFVKRNGKGGSVMNRRHIAAALKKLQQAAVSCDGVRLATPFACRHVAAALAAAAIFAAPAGALANSGGHSSGNDYIGDAPYNVTINEEVKGFAYGRYETTASASDATLSIVTGGKVMTVFGGYSWEGSATGNTVILSKEAGKEAPVLGGRLYGGFSENPYAAVSNNTLQVEAVGLSAPEIRNFDNYKFVLPSDVKAGDTMLSLSAQTADLAIDGSKVDVSLAGGSIGNTGLNDSVTLLHKTGGRGAFSLENLNGAVQTSKLDGVASGFDVMKYTLNKPAGEDKLNVTVSELHLYGDGGTNTSGRRETDNTLTITGGKANVAFGGRAASGDVTENKATMSGGEIVIGNAILVGDANVTGMLFGGLAETGNAEKNTVEVSGGTVNSWVTGGHSLTTGSAKENSVTISSGAVKYVSGGRSRSGSAEDNRVTISGGTATDFVYGGRSNSGSAKDNSVTISGGTVKHVYGGDSDSGSAEDNTVIISGGEIKGYVYGGYSYSGSAENNTVIIRSGTVEKNVYGGWSDSGSATGNTVILSKEEGKAPPVLGGRLSGGVSENSDATVSNNTLQVEAVGLSAPKIRNFDNYKFVLPSDVKADDTMLSLSAQTENLAIDGSKVDVSLAGGSIGNTGLNDSVTLLHKTGGDRAFSVENLTGAVQTSKLDGVASGFDVMKYTLNKPAGEDKLNVTVSELHLYGDGGTNTPGRRETDNTLTIKSGKANVAFGGRVDDGYVRGNTVTMEGGELVELADEENPNYSISGNLYGGYSYSLSTHNDSFATGNTVVISGGKIGRGVYGGYAENGDATGNTVVFSGGTVGTAVYGEGGTEGVVYGGYSKRGNATGNTVVFSGGMIGTSAYGEGGTEGVVYGGYSERRNATGNTVVLGEGLTGRTFGSLSLYGGKVNSSGSDSFSGNTLQVEGRNINVYKVNAFENYTFILPQSVKAGDTMLGYKVGDVIIDGGKVRVASGGRLGLNLGESVTLLKASSNFTESGLIVINNDKLPTLTERLDNVATGFETLVAKVEKPDSENELTLTVTEKFLYGDGGINTSGQRETGNTLTITGGKANVAFGGRAVSGDVTGNKVTMSGGEIVTENAIWIGDTYVSGNLYGGFADAGNAEKNTVEVSGGTVYDVYGGYSRSGSAENNKVIISGGEINRYVNGGYSQTGSAKENSVIISGGTIKAKEGIVSYVAGGNVYQGSGSAAGNRVTISGGTLEVPVYGGYSEGGDVAVEKNRVILSKEKNGSAPVLKGTLYGGFNSENNDNVSNNTLQVEAVGLSAPEIRNFDNYKFVLPSDVKAGDTMLSLSAQANDLAVDGSKVGVSLANGTLTDLGLGLDDSVTLLHKTDADGSGTFKVNNEDELPVLKERLDNVATGFETLVAKVEKPDSEDKLTLTVTDKHLYGDGGTNTPGRRETGNTLTITGGKANVAFGGRAATGDVTGNKVTMSGGDIVEGNIIWIGDTIDVSGDLYGGFVDIGNAEKNTVEVSGGTVNIWVAGGYSNSGSVKGNTVTVSGEAVVHDVYGGRSRSGSAEGNRVTVSGGTVTDFVYGGRSDSGSAEGNTVTISGGTVDGSVTGGMGSGGNATGNTVSIHGGRVGGAVHGGTGEGNVSGNRVLADGGLITGYSIEGGSVGLNGNAVGNAVTVAGSATVQSQMIRGGMSDRGIAEKNSVTLGGGIFTSAVKVIGGRGFTGVTDNAVNLTGDTKGLDGAKLYGYDNGAASHSGNELHVGGVKTYDANGKATVTRATWQGMDAGGTHTNKVDTVANFDSIALHNVVWSNDVPALSAKNMENIGGLDVTGLEFFTHPDNSTVHEHALTDYMVLVHSDNNDLTGMKISYKDEGTVKTEALTNKGINYHEVTHHSAENGVTVDGKEVKRIFLAEHNQSVDFFYHIDGEKITLGDVAFVKDGTARYLDRRFDVTDAAIDADSLKMTADSLKKAAAGDTMTVLDAEDAVKNAKGETLKAFADKTYDVAFADTIATKNLAMEGTRTDTLTGADPANAGGNAATGTKLFYVVGANDVATAALGGDIAWQDGGVHYENGTEENQDGHKATYTFNNNSAIDVAKVTFTAAADPLAGATKTMTLLKDVDGAVEANVSGVPQFGVTLAQNHTALEATANGAVRVTDTSGTTDVTYTVTGVRLDKVTVQGAGDAADTVPDNWTVAGGAAIDTENMVLPANMEAGTEKTILTANGVADFRDAAVTGKNAFTVHEPFTEEEMGVTVTGDKTGGVKKSADHKAIVYQAVKDHVAGITLSEVAFAKDGTARAFTNAYDVVTANINAENLQMTADSMKAVNAGDSMTVLDASQAIPNAKGETLAAFGDKTYDVAFSDQVTGNGANGTGSVLTLSGIHTDTLSQNAEKTKLTYTVGEKNVSDATMTGELAWQDGGTHYTNTTYNFNADAKTDLQGLAFATVTSDPMGQSMILIGGKAAGTVENAPASFGVSLAKANTTLEATAAGTAAVANGDVTYSVTGVTLDKVTVNQVTAVADTVPDTWTVAKDASGKAALTIDTENMQLPTGSANTKHAILTIADGSFAGATVTGQYAYASHSPFTKANGGVSIAGEKEGGVKLSNDNKSVVYHVVQDHVKDVTLGSVNFAKNSTLLTVGDEYEFTKVNTVNTQNFAMNYANPQTVAAHESMTLLQANNTLQANALLANMAADVKTKTQAYSFSPAEGVNVAARITGSLGTTATGDGFTYTVNSNQADKLTFGSVDWKDSGALLTRPANITFAGADVDTSKIHFKNIHELDANKQMMLVSDFGNKVGQIVGSKYYIGTTLEGEGSASLNAEGNLMFTTKTGVNRSSLHAQEQTHNTVMGMMAGIGLLASGAEQISRAMETLSMQEDSGSGTGGTGSSMTDGSGSPAGQSGSGSSGTGSGSATGTETGRGGSGQSDQQEGQTEAGGSIIASIGGGKMHQETGSHVTSNTWNGVLGIGGKRSSARGTLQYAAFAEHGRADFTLHSDTGRGDGDSRYTGGGIIGKWQNRRDVYVEASIRAGRLHDTASDMLYDEATGRSYGYDVHANYIGGHVGIGKVFNYRNGRTLDVYGKYFHMKRDGVSFEAGGHFDLDSVTSSVLRVGARYGATDKKWNWYGGLAYEYEFDGKATGRADGAPIRAASIEGGSVRAEIGLRMEATKTSPWKADINLSGYAGKRRGISGNVAVAYTF